MGLQSALEKWWDEACSNAGCEYFDGVCRYCGEYDEDYEG